MSLWRSAPGGLRLVGWRALVLAMAAILLLPALIGAAALGAQMLLADSAIGPTADRVRPAAMLLLLSPLIAWLGYLIALPVVAALLRQGWFGWPPALLTGGVVGGGIGLAMHHPLPLPFATLTFLMLRALLGRLRPAAFTL